MRAVRVYRFRGALALELSLKLRKAILFDLIHSLDSIAPRLETNYSDEYSYKVYY